MVKTLPEDLPTRLTYFKTIQSPIRHFLNCQQLIKLSDQFIALPRLLERNEICFNSPRLKPNRTDPSYSLRLPVTADACCAVGEPFKVSFPSSSLSSTVHTFVCIPSTMLKRTLGPIELGPKAIMRCTCQPVSASNSVSCSLNWLRMVSADGSSHVFVWFKRFRSRSCDVLSSRNLVHSSGNGLARVATVTRLSADCSSAFPEKSTN